ncbi:hypothetical protein [Sporosarcina sp. HYO08]|nr:hypothetical protein [Sporosarcina sp. HYO08]
MSMGKIAEDLGLKKTVQQHFERARVKVKERVGEEASLRTKPLSI